MRQRALTSIHFGMVETTTENQTRINNSNQRHRGHVQLPNLSRRSYRMTKNDNKSRYKLILHTRRIKSVYFRIDKKKSKKNNIYIIIFCWKINSLSLIKTCITCNHGVK